MEAWIVITIIALAALLLGPGKERMRREDWEEFHRHKRHHPPHKHRRKAKHLNLRFFIISEGRLVMTATPVTVIVGQSVLFSIAPTDANGGDASADVPASGVAFSLSNPAIGALTLNADGESGTIVTNAVGTATLNVTAATLSGATLTDSGDITVNPRVLPAVALNLKVVAA